MEEGVSLTVSNLDAMPQNLAATDLTRIYRWAWSPEQIIATIKHDQRLGTAHIILNSVPETIDNILATIGRCAGGVRPALG